MSPKLETSRRAKPALHWNVERVVSELRALRLNALEQRQKQDRPPKMPSRANLTAVLEGLCAALFPNRLGPPDLTDEGVDYFVGHTLETQLRALFEEIRLELSFASGLTGKGGADHQRRAFEITREFAAHLPEVRRILETDIQAGYQGDPAAKSLDEVLVCYPGTTAIAYHRIAHVLHRLGAPLVARIIAEIAHSETGIDIHPAAQIGGSFFIDHGTGVVIGETAIIGERVRLYQAVTLGAKRFPVDESGVLIKGNARHPIVEDDVVIYAGATILGRITIGRGSVIGGNVWLTRSVPPGSHISQAQVRNELFEAGAGI
ncbi:serine O-acetyltransferase EpsC [Candidatus Methylocalor cossyra]|uniref:serine O-acetyltransferase n=1 Tax=Candidatus Methylocalor cossyra TaxID=3108543 RepID=A0ABM9NMD7_9GAMM